MSQQEEDAKMIEEMERLEREATQGKVQTEKRNDTFQVCVPYTGEHPSAKQWIATFPEHRNGDFELFVAARNRLPQLLALARVGVLAVAIHDDGVISCIGESRATVAVIDAFRDLIDAYKEKHK